MIENHRIENIRNFSIIAHVDHGKSTLADRFLELTKTVPLEKMQPQYLDRMPLERERGITIKLQPVTMIWQTPNHQIQNSKSEIRNKSQISNSKNSRSFEFRASDFEFPSSAYMLNLIDTPGHIDFYYEVTRTLAAVEGAILLVDASQGVQAQTISHLEAAKKQNLVIIPVINKIDIPGINLEQVKKEIVSLLKIKEEEILLASAKSGQGIEEILNQTIKKILPPKGSKENPLKAFVFDSLYDEFRGVIFYIRIFDGKVKSGDYLKMINSGQKAKVLEVGIFKPERTPASELSAGQIGYMVTDLKEISQCRVGETVTLAYRISPMANRQLSNKQLAISDKQVEPLRGYQEPLPMVFAGFYPVQAQDWEKFRLALNKLKLNDASFTFDLEHSPSLGYGARIGALGSLHLEIIKERLISEYNLDLIIGSPSVKYLVKTKDDREIYIQNPEKFPPREKISSILEPWLKVEIVSPVQFSSLIFQLVKNFRGKIISQRYLLQEEESSKIIIQVEMPLALIIIDFYDKLKSVSSGYATLFWQFLEYRPANLVKLDILIAGEKFPSLAKLVYQDEVLKKASQMVERLKKVMPRQLFEVKIQAAVSGKIISSAALPALRKDVTKKLYGGDITRKMKLLAKQREGKKKLLRLSKVDLPKEVYWEIIKN